MKREDSYRRKNKKATVFSCQEPSSWFYKPLSVCQEIPRARARSWCTKSVVPNRGETLSREEFH